ncbi:transporter substrate-binding domain-containing protein [Streptomyces sp. GESEQ-35]|uniref:transporter substrate-binding domain-containing protein n=1 Tax=Streptomyces sp. GESEQ-35 TaxID=2812657 RepID=UPI001B326BD3|nr:transporter substrate-binding domain-containing protein [Streptomyces sp. GESEQ-35]
MNLPGFRSRLRSTAALALLPLLALTACGSGDTDAAAVGAQASPAPTDDPIAAVREVDAVAALLPADVRQAGTLRVGSSIGFPPGAYYPNGSDKAPAGQDIDIADAVAKVLGVKLERQDASFETILPALGSGKYDFGTGNFGVTTERLKTIDFVTYINDGQGFVVKKGNTALGTKVTGIMSTINGLRYQAAQPASQTTFLGEFHRLDVGFAFKKRSPLTEAFQAAVNELIEDGTYGRILKKWGTSASAIDASRVNPPEHR